MVLLEACASGKPVAASKVGSVGDLIADGVDGFCPEAGDIAALGRSLERLCTEEQLGAECARRSYEKLAAVYDVLPWTEKIFAVYNEVLQTR